MNPLCKPWEHAASRRHFLGASAGALAFGALGLLLVGLRFLPAYLPELFGLAGVAVTALIAQLARRRTSGGFNTPGTGQRSAVRTQFLDAWIDHGKTKVGYEIPFNRHFYVFKPPRELAEIDIELKKVTDRILAMIGGLSK